MRNLRVLFLATRDWYHPATTGGDNTLWENARYLASAGHSVTLLAASYGRAPRSEIRDGIHVVRLGGIHSLWLRTFVYYMLHCRGKYDVVVAEGFGGSRLPRMAPLYVREPVITEWHQVHRDLFAAQYPGLLQGPLNLLERVVAWVHRDTLVRAGTEEWRQQFPSIGFRPENVFVVPVSIRDEWLTQSIAARPQVPTAIWIGKFRRYKCPDHAIRAMANVTKQIPSARLLLIGRHDDLAYEAHLQRLTRDLKLQDAVEFHFNVSEEEKRNLLLASRVLLLPSAVEGFGVVVLEANACGVPVIASSGVPEGAVRDGVNGKRYSFADIQQLTESIVTLLTDDELHRKLSDSSVQFATKFRWHEVGAMFERVVAGAASPEAVPA